MGRMAREKQIHDWQKSNCNIEAPFVAKWSDINEELSGWSMSELQIHAQNPNVKILGIRCGRKLYDTTNAFNPPMLSNTMPLTPKMYNSTWP